MNTLITISRYMAFAIIAFFAYTVSAQAGDTNTVEMSTFAAPMVSASAERAGYNRFREKLQSMGLLNAGSQPIITQTNLRLEAVLEPNSSTISWNVLKAAGSNLERPLEIKLNSGQQSYFFVHAMGLFIQKEDANGGNQANRPLFSYVDYNYFKEEGEAKALETLYQGKMSLTTGSIQRMENFSTHHLQHRPAKTFEPAAVTSQGSHEFPQYGATLEEQGYFMLHPNYILQGGDSSTFNLELGDGERTAIKGGNDVDGVASRNVAVLMLQGWMYNGVTGDGTCLSV